MFVFHSCKRSGPLTMLLVNSSCAVSFSAVFVCCCALPITDVQSCSHNVFCCVCVCPKALCAAVVLPDILQTMALVFSGADVMCATGDPKYSTPYLLAQKAGQRLQMEFLYHNKLSGVCWSYDVYRPPYFAISREMRATTYTMFRVVRFNFFKEIHTFIQQEHSKLISISHNIYNVTKYFLFQINSVLYNFLFIKESRFFLITVSTNVKQHIAMISERCCDTEDWSNQC